MALHQIIQRVLLIGVRLNYPRPSPTPIPPERLVPFIEAIAPEHEKFNEGAVLFGHRYRSGFWAIYL